MPWTTGGFFMLLWPWSIFFDKAVCLQRGFVLRYPPSSTVLVIQLSLGRAGARLIATSTMDGEEGTPRA